MDDRVTFVTWRFSGNSYVYVYYKLNAVIYQGEPIAVRYRVGKGEAGFRLGKGSRKKRGKSSQAQREEHRTTRAILC